MARAEHELMDQKLDGLIVDVALLKESMRSVKPNITLLSEFRLRTISLISAIAMLSGILGHDAIAAVKKFFE